MSKHALLSASSAERWLHCTPSARLEADLPDAAGSAAAKGTLAHAIAELKVRKAFVEPMGPRKFANALKKLKTDERYEADMDHNTDIYLETVTEIVHNYVAPPYVAVEQKLDFSQVVPEGFGTVDCVVIGGQTLNIIDYKNGQGVPVSAEENAQMRLYALGALARYGLLYDIRQVRTTIVQPKVYPEPQIDELSKDELLAWAESIRPTAQLAYEGKGKHTPGVWCKFCKARATCRAQAENMAELEAYGYKRPPLLTPDEVGDILERGRLVKAWITDLEEWALAQALAGRNIPGWKAVEGRSIRQFKDIDAAFDIARNAGVDEAMLYERKPITLTAMEKLLGKPEFERLLGEQVVKPQGKPTLAPLSDKRAPINNNVSATEAFAN